jgi:hypothetical protein
MNGLELYALCALIDLIVSSFDTTTYGNTTLLQLGVIPKYCTRAKICKSKKKYIFKRN